MMTDVEVLVTYRETKNWTTTARMAGMNRARVKLAVRRASKEEHRNVRSRQAGSYR